MADVKPLKILNGEIAEIDPNNDGITAEGFTAKSYLNSEGPLNMNLNKITSVGTPSLSGDVANKFYVDDQITITSQAIQVDNEPTGFVNREDSQISFDDSSRIFTIQPTNTSYDFWVSSQKYTRTGIDSVTIPDIEGLYFIYFNGDSLEFDSPPLAVNPFKDVALVSIIYWDAANNKSIYFAEERHGLRMDGATHEYLHEIEGARYESGLALSNFAVDGDGSLESHAQLDCSNGIIRDEDILIDIQNGQPQSLTPVAQLPVYYRSGTSGYWRKKEADNHPFIYSGTSGYTGGSGLVPFNNFDGLSWGLTEITNNNFVLVHIFATNNINEPIIAIQGINQYNNAGLAREAAEVEIKSLSGLPFAEFSPLGTVIVKSSVSFTNTPQSIFVSTAGGDNYIDFRDVKVFGSGSATDHGSLGGLLDDDHTIYLRADGNRAMQGDLDMAGFKVVSLADPVSDSDAATKFYVDSQISADTDTTLPFSASGAIAIGAPVYIVKTANETVAEADASSIGTSRLIGISKQDISDSTIGEVITSGFANIPTDQIDGGTFDIGEPVFLSENVGKLTSSSPTTSNSRVYQVGLAVSSNKIVVDLKQGVLNS